MKNIKSQLESFRYMGPNSKIFFLTLIGIMENKLHFLAGIFEPGEACKINHARIDRLISHLENPIKKGFSGYKILSAPEVDTTSIARAILDKVGITKDAYEAMEVTAGNGTTCITGFRFSIAETNNQPMVETLKLLKWTQENSIFFRKQEEKTNMEDLDKINFERFVLEEKWEKEKQLAEV